MSTGPFKVEKYTSGQSVSLVRNENYFGPKPYLDKVVFTVVPDPNTQIAQALSGDITIMILDNKAAVDRVKTANGLVVASRPLVQYYWLALNQTDQRFTDVRVRQAFVQAIDRQAIIKSVELGYGSIANSPITPALAAYYDPSLASKYPYDPQKAKEFAPLFYDVYESVDTAFGEMMKNAAPDDNVFVISDHGFGPVYYAVYMNNWLMTNKYLRLKRSTGTRFRRMLFGLGITTDFLFRSAKKLITLR